MWKKILEYIDKIFDWIDKYSIYLFTFVEFYYLFVVNVFFLFWIDSDNEKYICGKVYNSSVYKDYKFKESRLEVYVKFCKKLLFRLEFVSIKLKLKSKSSYSLDEINFLYNCVHFLLKNVYCYNFFFFFVIKAWFNKVVKAKYGNFSVCLCADFDLDIKDNAIGKIVIFDIFYVVLLNTYIAYIDGLYVKAFIVKSYLKQTVMSLDCCEIKRVSGLVWPWWKFWYYPSWVKSNGDLKSVLNSYELFCNVLGDLGVKYERLLKGHEERIKYNLRIISFNLKR